MSQFLRSAPKTGIATFVPLPATPGTVVVPVSDPLSLLRMVVIDLNADPGASNQMVTLKTGGVLVGAEFFLMLRSSVAVAGAPFVIVQDESLGVIYGFSLAGVTADSYRWVKVRWNGGSSWEVVSYYISGAPHTTLSGDGLTLGEQSTVKGSLELLSDAHAHSTVLEPNSSAGDDVDVFMPPSSGVLATQEWAAARRCNKVLASDQSYTSNTTLADTGLSLTLEGNTLYAIEGTLFVAAHTSGGFKVGFNGTAGVTALLVHLLAQRYENDTGSILGADSLSALGTSFGLTTGAISGSDIEVNLRGFIHTSTAGTLTLRAAQNASFATATTVKKGSYFKFEKADA